MSMGSVQPGGPPQQPPPPQQPGYNAITDYSMGFGRIAQQPSFGSFYQQPFYQQPFYQPPMAPEYGYGGGMQYGGMPQFPYGQQMQGGLGSFFGQYQNPMTRSVRRGFGGQGGFGGGYGGGFGGGYGSGFGGMPQPMPQIGYGYGYGRPPQQPPMQYGGDFNRQGPTWTDPHSRLVAAPQLQDPAYVKAVQQVIASNLNDPRETSPFRQAQQQEASKTDYQRLMDQQRMAGMPELISSLGGIRNNILAPDDLQIAKSLGFKDPYAARDMLTWSKPPNDPEEMQIKQERQAKAKEYLNSIGYGQSGFDSSKYEVKREPIVSSGFTGLAGLFAGRSSSLV